MELELRDWNLFTTVNNYDDCAYGVFIVTAQGVQSSSLFRTGFCIAFLALIALPSGAWGVCGPGDCIYRNDLGFCRSCQFNPAHCHWGHSCIGCYPLYCWVPLTGGSEESGLDASNVEEAIPPDYAYFFEQLVPENCQDKDGEKTLQTVAVWAPTEILDQIKPYGLSISNELLKELAEVHPYAAFVVGQRMYRESGLMPPQDMHEGAQHMPFAIAGISNIDEANGDSTKINWELSELPEGVQSYGSHRDNFEGAGNPTISVESYMTVPGKALMEDHKKTTITLSSAPVYEEMVAVSDNYWAPVYEVEGFTTQTLSPSTSRDRTTDR